ncbi:MAG: hypothetical protein ACYTBJ_26425 [Planctomycetota bacterium]
MKITVTFKTPDVLEYALEDVPEEDRDMVEDKCRRWVKHGEYVTIQIDIENDTATVIEV